MASSTGTEVLVDELQTVVSTPSKQVPTVTPDDDDARFSFEQQKTNQGTTTTTTTTRRDTKRQRPKEGSPMKRMVSVISTSISRVAAGSARKSSSADDVPPIKRSFIGRTPRKKSSAAASDPNETFLPQAVDDGDASMQFDDSDPFLSEEIGITSDGEAEVSLVEEHPNGTSPVNPDESPSPPPSLTINVIVRQGDKSVLVSLHELGLSSETIAAVEAAVVAQLASQGHAVSQNKEQSSDNEGIAKSGFYDELTTTTKVGEKEFRHPASHTLVTNQVANQGEAAIKFANELFDQLFRAPQSGDDVVNRTYCEASKAIADGVSDEDLEIIGALSRAMVYETILDCGLEEALDPTRRRELEEWRQSDEAAFLTNQSE